MARTRIDQWRSMAWSTHNFTFTSIFCFWTYTRLERVIWWLNVSISLNTLLKIALYKYKYILYTIEFTWYCTFVLTKEFHDPSNRIHNTATIIHTVNYYCILRVTINRIILREFFCFAHGVLNHLFCIISH